MPLVHASDVELRWNVVAELDAVLLRVATRRFALARGMGPPDCWKLAIAVSELATNMVKYARAGTVTLTVIQGRAIRIDACDEGPGCIDIDLAMQDHVSEGRNLHLDPSILDRRGLGTGLGATSRMLDEFYIEGAVGGGMRIVGIKRLARG
jgi:serine/threonine-protein kinase RsbT